MAFDCDVGFGEIFVNNVFVEARPGREKSIFHGSEPTGGGWAKIAWV